jgi:hypothetical protein|tara:strand:- start:239 stop:475 length:237 start_codon:yes stop_codon:yes gene_type:complete
MAQYLYENDSGWNKLQLCRTSDVYERNAFEWYSSRGGLPRDMKLQKAKFQVFTLYNEKLGAITAQEYLVSYELKGPRV